MTRFERLIRATQGKTETGILMFAWIPAAALIIMTVDIIANVFARFIFNYPLLGTVEIVTLFLVIVALFTFAYCEVREGHVRVTLLVATFPRRVNEVISRIVYLITTVYFALAAWQGWVLMMGNITPIFSVSDQLSIPYFFLYLFIAIGCALIALTRFLKTFYPPLEVLQREGDTE